MTGNELFEEILFYHCSDLTLREKYIRLYALLDRLCKQLTADSAADFSNLFSRLHYLCELREIPSKAIEVFRIHGKQAQQTRLSPRSFPLTEEDYLYDLKALCELVSRLSSEAIPGSLLHDLPRQWRPLPTSTYQSEERKRMRVVAVRWDQDFIYAYDKPSRLTNRFPLSVRKPSNPSALNCSRVPSSTCWQYTPTKQVSCLRKSLSLNRTT